MGITEELQVHEKIMSSLHHQYIMCCNVSSYYIIITSSSYYIIDYNLPDIMTSFPTGVWQQCAGINLPPHIHHHWGVHFRQPRGCSSRHKPG